MQVRFKFVNGNQGGDLYPRVTIDQIKLIYLGEELQRLEDEDSIEWRKRDFIPMILGMILDLHSVSPVRIIFGYGVDDLQDGIARYGMGASYKLKNYSVGLDGNH